MLQKIKHTLEMIKFSHSIFALPFALASLFWATRGHPKPQIVVLVILAMVFARSAAMAFNRLVDKDLDAINPRTKERHLPANILSMRFVIFFTLISVAAFFIVCYFINDLSFKLSPLALGIIFFYSLTKRFTHLTQIALGLALGISPIAAWIAATGSFNAIPLLLGLAVLCWVAGFDIIYAIQDYDFDRQKKVGSLVVALGITKALYLARFLHILTIVLLVVAGVFYSAGFIYYITLLLVGLLFIYEHKLVTPQNLTKINAAFFMVNGFIGIIFFIGILLDLYILG
ncbi:MAG: hypothetical protein ACD_73C00243G0002 [uncultured bacterium]|nr:MAG: hypothetical protein ACD_73C00243G0002 [uncultured bacterium]